jgi:23S rRNA (adenine2503-C2)-methyltransferase
MEGKKNIFGRTIGELREITVKTGLPSYTAKQISTWLYKNNAYAFDEMTDLSLSARKMIGEEYTIEKTAPVKSETSSDGTVKFMFPVLNGKFIETVLIPEKERNTLCISTQAGCKMACIFCMTGRQGFHGDLDSGAILNQLVSIPGNPPLSNIVLMGMGEPLDNIDNVLNALEVMTSGYGYAMSPSRITLSTTGLLPALKKFLENSRCHLALSLNSPFSDERSDLMPVEKAYPAKKVVDFLKDQTFSRQRRISIEYIMFRGLNDTPRHAKGLASLLNGLRCRINLISYHKLPGDPLEPSDSKTMHWFKDRLNEKGILTTIRVSRGYDIKAACGMLAAGGNSA